MHPRVYHALLRAAPTMRPALQALSMLRGGFTGTDMGAISAVVAPLTPTEPCAAFNDVFQALKQALSEETKQAYTSAVGGCAKLTALFATPPNECVAGYHVVEVIAKGTFGVALKVEHDVSKQVAVIKLGINQTALGTSGAPVVANPIAREVEMQRKAHAHGIAPAVHCMITTGDLYVVRMEYVPGITLHQYFDKHGITFFADDDQPGDAWWRKLEPHLLTLLTKLRDANMTHGDFHTKNIMVLEDRSGEVSGLRLLDYGFATDKFADLHVDVVKLRDVLYGGSPFPSSLLFPFFQRAMALDPACFAPERLLEEFQFPKMQYYNDYWTHFKERTERLCDMSLDEQEQVYLARRGYEYAGARAFVNPFVIPPLPRDSTSSAEGAEEHKESEEEEEEEGVENETQEQYIARIMKRKPPGFYGSASLGSPGSPGYAPLTPLYAYGRNVRPRHGYY